MAKFVNGRGYYFGVKNQTDLNIDGSEAYFFGVTASTNLAFALVNIAIGYQYYIFITNSGTADIVIALPNNSDVSRLQFYTVRPGKSIELSLFYDGTKRIWHASGEI